MKRTIQIAAVLAACAALTTSCRGPALDASDRASEGGATSQASKPRREAATLDAGLRGSAQGRRPAPVKNFDWEAEQRRNAFSASLAPEQRRLKEALENGEWQSALDMATSLQAQFAANGQSNFNFLRQRAEAYIGLGRPEEAIRLYDEEGRYNGGDFDLTLALAQALTGRLSQEDARRAADLCVRYMNGVPQGYVRTPVTDNAKVAVVRTARAVDAFFTSQNESAVREARKALRLVPDEPVASYYLVSVLARKHPLTEAELREARHYYQVASVIPGSCGETARERVELADHMLRTGQYVN